MAKEITVGKETEMRKYRLAMGVSIKEVCSELFMEAGLYSAHECANREYSGNRKFEFEQDVMDAINKTVRKRKEAMYDLELNMCEDDEEGGLIWQCLTDALYNEALQLMASGRNIVQACVALEIDDVELTHRMRADGLDCNNITKEAIQHLLKG
ncbi:hypothetical protein B4086_5490 [Bacillus cereus]|nr:hypothetical protein B4086_5490 [Bacillus cereus]